jgi:hypothetical protein
MNDLWLIDPLAVAKLINAEVEKIAAASYKAMESLLEAMVMVRDLVALENKAAALDGLDRLITSLLNLVNNLEEIGGA